MNVLRCKVGGLFDAVTQNGSEALFRHLGKIGGISIDHGLFWKSLCALREQCRKELRLRVGVFFHGLVIIEVVLREVGEDRHIELDRADAALIEGVRGHFHRAAVAVHRGHIVEEFVVLEDVGSGLSRENVLADNPFDRADQSQNATSCAPSDGE